MGGLIVNDSEKGTVFKFWLRNFSLIFLEKQLSYERRYIRCFVVTRTEPVASDVSVAYNCIKAYNKTSSNLDRSKSRRPMKKLPMNDQ